MRQLLAALAVFLVASSSLAKSDTDSLKKILNSHGYMMTNPADDWSYAGGFLVSDKQGATFTDLPAEVAKPSTTEGHASFPAVEATKKSKLSIVLTGLATLIGGNPGGSFSRNSQETFKQLDAQGERITFQQANSLLNNPRLAPDIDTWLNTGHDVFIVGLVLKTRHISLTANSDISLGLSFNGNPVTDCSEKGNDNQNQSGKPNSNGNQNGGKDGNNQKQNSQSSQHQSSNLQKNPANAQASAQNAQSGQQNPSSSPNQPGGELHFCIDHKNKITMDTDNPLVFAAGAYQVLRTNNLTRLEPVMKAIKSGEFNYEIALDGAAGGEIQYTEPKVGVAGGVNPRWKRQPWPTKQ